MSSYRYHPPTNQIQARRTVPLVVGAPQIGFVLDRSGSMEAIKAETINGFNTLLAKQRQIQQDATLSLALFNDSVALIYDAVPIADVHPLTIESYAPRGTTALNDAIGMMVQALSKRASRLTPTLVIIVTDGDENSSRSFSDEHVRQMVRYRQSGHDWNFVFLGPISAHNYARSLGIPDDCIVDFDADATGITQIMDRLGSSLAAYRLGDRDFTLRLRA